MILATIDKIAKQMMGNMFDCQIRMIFLIVSNLAAERDTWSTFNVSH